MKIDISKNKNSTIEYTEQELNELDDLFNKVLETSQDFKKFLDTNKKDLNTLISDTDIIQQLSAKDSVRLLAILSPIMEYYTRLYGLIIDRIKEVSDSDKLKWLEILKEMYLIFTPIIKNLDYLGIKFNVLLSYNNALRTMSVASMLNSYFDNQLMNPNANGPDFISLAKNKNNDWINTESEPIDIKTLNRWFTRLNSVLLNKSSVDSLITIPSNQAPKILLKNIEYKLKKEFSYTLNNIANIKINVSENDRGANSDVSKWDGLVICFWGFDENNSYRCFITKDGDALNKIRSNLQIKKELVSISKIFLTQTLNMSSKMISNPMKRKDAQFFTMLDVMTYKWDYRVINKTTYFNKTWKTYNLDLWEIFVRLYDSHRNFIRYAVLQHLIKTYIEYQASFSSIQIQYNNKLNKLKAQNESTQELEEKFNKFKTEWDGLVLKLFNSYVDGRLITLDDIDSLYDDTKRDALLDENFKKWSKQLVFEGNLDDSEEKGFVDDLENTSDVALQEEIKEEILPKTKRRK